MNEKNTCLKKLSAAEFALWELHLYLDTHPADLQVLALYRKMQSKYMLLRHEYVDRFGPLTALEGEGVEWLKDPWPWEIEGCGC